MRFAVVVLVLISAGCRVTSSSQAVHPWDARGNYALSYDDRLTLDLTLAGALRHTTSTGHDVVSFGDFNGQPLKLDVAAFCARPDVVCPSEALTPRVSIDQTDAERSQPQHLIEVLGEAGLRYGGVVDHTKQDTFVVGLGAGAAAGAGCVALSLSVATGRFSHRGETVAEEPMWRTADGAACNPGAPDGGNGDCALQSTPGGVVYTGDAPVDGIADGKLITGWIGACAFAGLAADATLTVSTGFVGSRTGDYDPPAPIDAAVADSAFGDALESEDAAVADAAGAQGG